MVCVVALEFWANPCVVRADTFESRRDGLLKLLTGPRMLTEQQNSDVASYAYRRRWQYYHGCLARGIRLKEANRYFAESNEIVADEWPVLLFLRTYFAFKDTSLSGAARQRLADVLVDYKKNHRRSNVEPFGTGGNHSIVCFSMNLLTDQEFGNGPQHELARDKFIEWVRRQGRFGRDEVNSPHYLDRSLLPLLNLYDFLEDPKLKLWAQMAIDQMMTDFVLLSIDNVRGGPWCRAHHRHVPGVAEISDGAQDTFYVAGHYFFGNSPRPDYLFTDQILNYGFLVTTQYRPPRAIVRIADRETRGGYEARLRRNSVNSAPSPGPVDWSMYYYMTPSYSLGSLQNRVELDNHVTGRVTRDFKNTQVWELTFSDPMKILGPKRELRVTTGEDKEFVEPSNPNTANMQYRNVLFYKGEFMDYNQNLAANGGDQTHLAVGDRQCHFWRVSTPGGAVFVGITHFAQAGGGILEVDTEHEHSDYSTFKKRIQSNQATCRDTGLATTYTNCRGERIAYNHGKGTVNGRPWPLDGYELYDCPFVKSKHGSGLITIGNDALGTVTLDFRDPTNPVRTVR